MAIGLHNFPNNISNNTKNEEKLLKKSGACDIILLY